MITLPENGISDLIANVSSLFDTFGGYVVFVIAVVAGVFVVTSLISSVRGDKDDK